MQRRDAGLRRGVALIETLIALVLLAFAGTGMVSLLAQTLNRDHDVHAREAETADAARLLGAIAVLPRSDLVDRIGVAREPALWLEVDQRSASLFDVVVRDTLRRTELVQTTLFRPDTAP